MDRLLSRRVFTFEAADGHGPDAELQAMRAFEPEYIYGYPSVVQEMVRHLAANDVRVPGVTATVLTAERVPPSLIAEVHEEIGCPTIREYGCSEMDIIAFDCPAGRYHVASDHVIIESVAAEDGTGEAIVTDLDNMLTPLIRYRLGDRIELSREACPCGRTSPVIASIEGRTGDRRYLVYPDGRRRHSVLFAYLFERLRERGLPIHQFLVEQPALDMIRVNLDMGDEDLDPQVSTVVKREIAAEVGTDFSIEVMQVPLRRQSGAKWNYFVSLDRTEPDRS